MQNQPRLQSGFFMATLNRENFFEDLRQNKSSTINALFDADVAKVGTRVDPETMDVKYYKLKNLILWDTPGFGDGVEADARHAKNIIRKLNEVDKNGKALIDLVLVILDGGTRDLGTSYELINKVIIPNLGENKKNRILVAINIWS